MWQKIADFVLRFRVLLIIVILAITGVMGYYTTKVRMSYDSTGAIPTTNPKYKVYRDFQNKFGNNGNSIVLGVKTDKLFEPAMFKAYLDLVDQIKKVPSVEGVLSIADAVSLGKDSSGKLTGTPIFNKQQLQNLDSSKTVFQSLPIYNGLLYNKDSNAYLMMVTINKEDLGTKERVRIINDIVSVGDDFQLKQKTDVHYSGLPFIRTQMAEKIKKELNLFLALSLGLTALILLIIFRSFTAMLVSMLIVSIGVIWSFGALAIFGYKISILTGVIPPLVVVIGIPNCIYFLNKYHTEYNLTGDKMTALRNMVGKMGIVTLFTNLTAAIGFGVFSFTDSVVLKEFGLVAGLNIMALFFVSLILIPAVFSFLPAPHTNQTKYTESKVMNGLLNKITTWVFDHKKTIFAGTLVLCAAGLFGIFRLKSVGHMVDDLPSKDVILTDLKFFEHNFKGIMPLDISIDTKKKYGALTSLETWEKVDALTNFLEAQPEIGGGITLIKGVKFVKQGFSGGGAENYALPSATEFSGIRPQLLSTFNKQKHPQSDTAKSGDQLNKMLYSFVDSNAQTIRVSVNVADIGSVEMPKLIDTRIKPLIDSLFEKDKYDVHITGASIIYLEGSNFIINSLKESLLWAFAMILVCIIILFRSGKIVFMALLTNIVPLMITAGVMGWLNIPLKPSTVLVFSVALGITVDVTIRFLVNYKQELPKHNSVADTVRYTIKDTGLSIIFTSIILVVGFGVFAVSEFGGTQALGYLTSLTLFLAMVFNLTLLPALLLVMDRKKTKK
ncbi:RND transporter [Taibaiella sp. KBW10]|uniref:efflux RND transporter permease subunit n=1 Tax=Taibaiella sp. KBW10 TaxID=2153357 RepID=UPI000F5A908C|nr:MMPL family transporter [Taibaiella sp. KBW10]RQO30189.1 RND transporter [Taibaiella sp. KBW10]